LLLSQSVRAFEVEALIQNVGYFQTKNPPRSPRAG
jgi:hypothetical protein